MILSDKALRILTWHVHGSYLYYLSQVPFTFYLPYREGNEEGYGARTPSFPWGENVISVPAEKIKEMEFDCILFQSRKNYLVDQFDILTEEQRMLPRIYLEHDPPREHPTDTNHIVNDPNILLVHVTHFNRMMWENNMTPVKVIEHGVMIDPSVHYNGELEKGIVVINGISKRGRRLGYDIYQRVRDEVPLDLVGMDSEEAGGLGEVRNSELPEFMSRYRFFFNPIRYTSLGLSVCEAMMAGMPVIGLATTEMAVTIVNDHSGYIHTDIDWLIRKMKQLLNDPYKAYRLGLGAREIAMDRFNIKRFSDCWKETFQEVVSQNLALIV